tara:strand:+ start:903 stop:1367 length:465 start_codon:yes stop_codon:yes gene_type:complete
MKLYTDEEMMKKCIEFDPVPLFMEKHVLHKQPRNDRKSILSGIIDSDIQDYQPINNIAAYANNISKLYPVKAKSVLKEYTSIVDKKLKEHNKKVEAELTEKMVYEDEIKEMYEPTPEPVIEPNLPPMPQKRARRTKEQIKESKDMGREDARYDL